MRTKALARMCLLGKYGVTILCLFFVFTGCNQPTSGSAAPPQTVTDNEDLQLLKNLGMTNLSTDEERSGDVDNPMGRTTSNMNRTDEIFTIGTADNGNAVTYVANNTDADTMSIGGADDTAI